MNELLDKALNFFKLEKYDDALFIYNKILENDPLNINALAYKGFILVILERYQEAKVSIEGAISLGANDFRIYKRLGICYFNLGEFSKSIFYYTKAIEDNDQESSIYYNRAVAFSKVEKYNEAILDLNIVITLEGFSEDILLKRGSCFESLGKTHDAISDFESILHINPKSSDAYYNRGNSYLKLNNFEAALEDFEMAFKLNPNDIDILNNFGILNFIIGDKRDGIIKLLIAAKNGDSDALNKINFLKKNFN